MLLLEIIKMLSDETNELKINYLIGVVTKKILRYCNLDTLPIELEDVVVQIVVDRIKTEDPAITEIAGLKFQQTPSPVDELTPHKSLLNSFRKISYI